MKSLRDFRRIFKFSKFAIKRVVTDKDFWIEVSTNWLLVRTRAVSKKISKLKHNLIFRLHLFFCAIDAGFSVSCEQGLIEGKIIEIINVFSNSKILIQFISQSFWTQLRFYIWLRFLNFGQFWNFVFCERIFVNHGKEWIFFNVYVVCQDTLQRASCDFTSNIRFEVFL